MTTKKEPLVKPTFKDDAILNRRIEQIALKRGITPNQAHLILRMWFSQVSKQLNEASMQDLNSSLMSRVVIPNFGKFVPNLPRLKRYWAKNNIDIDTTNLPKRIYV
jgi:hypothetical protein